jgi:hypothetical protein
MGILRHIMRDVVKPVLVDVGDRFWTNPWRSISPIKLKVEYTDTQFKFQFTLPSTSTLVIYDGDGTVTEVAGQDATAVQHYTNYSNPGTYYFYVEGDYVNLTTVSVNNPAYPNNPYRINLNLDRFGELVNLEAVNFGKIGLSGNIEVFNKCVSPFGLFINGFTALYGNVEEFEGFNFDLFNIGGATAVKGDLSVIVSNMLGICTALFTAVTFDNIVNWTLAGDMNCMSCDWDSTMVDNCLISLANGETTGKTINIAGTNAARTSASDVAFAYLDANNNLTVNSPE